MKGNFKLLMPLMLLASVSTFTSCSSSDDGSEGNSGQVDGVELNALAGVWNIDNYTMTMYANNTFDAVDNSTHKNYAGVYSYAGDVLSLSGVTTRAFTLEEGKTYTFMVKKEGNTIVLTNPETRQSFKATYVGDAPQPASEYLNPSQEKAFIEAQARNFESYFEAREWEEYAELGKQVYSVNNGDLNRLEKDFLLSTMTDSYTNKSDRYDWVESNYNGSEGWTNIYKVYTYATTNEYWDECLMASNLSGEYTVVDGKWVCTKKDGDLTFRFTSKDGAQWVLAVQKSGSTGSLKIDEDDVLYETIWIPSIGAGDVLVDKRDSVVSVTSIFKKYYIDVPTHVTATLTRNGEERIKTVVNIDNFTNRYAKKNKLSFIGKSNGSASVYIKTLGEPFEVKTTFNYADGNNSSCTAQITKGSKTLVDLSAAFVPVTQSYDKLENVTNVSVKASMLGGLTAELALNNYIDVADAFEEADENETDASVVNNAKDKINSNIAGYIYNTPSSRTRQAELVMNVMPYEKERWDYVVSHDTWQRTTMTAYELVPVLRFYDSSSYAFPDYFTNVFFKGVIDKAKEIVGDFSDMIEK